MGADILKLPLTYNGNQYVLIFLDYLKKWVEAFSITDQKAETVACVLKRSSADMVLQNVCYQIEVPTFSRNSLPSHANQETKYLWVSSADRRASGHIPQMFDFDAVDAC